MATYRCEVITVWEVTESGINEMAAALAYPADWSDVTEGNNVIPDPNALVTYGQHLSEAQMDALIADPAFTVLWSEVE